MHKHRIVINSRFWMKLKLCDKEKGPLSLRVYQHASSLTVNKWLNETDRKSKNKTNTKRQDTRERQKQSKQRSWKRGNLTGFVVKESREKSKRESESQWLALIWKSAWIRLHCSSMTMKSHSASPVPLCNFTLSPFSLSITISISSVALHPSKY